MSRTTSTQDDGPSSFHHQAAQGVVQRSPGILDAIPEPPELMHGLGRDETQGMMRLANYGVLQRVERCSGQHCDRNPSDCSVLIWRATQPAYDRLVQYRESLEILPCGHRPFRNRRGPGFGCLDDDCEARYTREQVEAVLEGGDGA